jgi:tetratricopeptide (TPR) repeat protein
MADNPVHTMKILTAAIKLDPKNLNFYVDRVQIAAVQKDYKRALNDLDKVLEEEPGYVDALVFRISAKRQLNQTDSAAVDIGQALAKNEDHLEGLLERGMLRRMFNDISGAQSDWLKIIKFSQDSETARFARKNIQNMDGQR